MLRIAWNGEEIDQKLTAEISSNETSLYFRVQKLQPCKLLGQVPLESFKGIIINQIVKMIIARTVDTGWFKEKSMMLEGYF